MASATYLQSLDSVYEDGTSRGITPSNRRQIESFIASAAIVAGDLVSLDISKIAAANPGVPASKGWSEAAIADAVLYIKKADSTTSPGVAASGFALEAATAAGDVIKVTVAGIHAEAKLAAAVNQGDRLKVTGTPGEAAAYGAGDTVPVIGYALADFDAAAKTPVFVIKQF